MRKLPRPTIAASALCFAVLVHAPAAARQTVAEKEPQFVASSRGSVYYSVLCDAWRRLAVANLRFFGTALDAEAAGYSPSTARGCAPQLDTAQIRPSIGGRAECVVARIIDGDTFQCEGGSRVRLLIADADEVGQSPWADSAVAFLGRMMRPGAAVRLEFDIDLFDRYQRLLAHVYVGDVSVNRELARRGFAQSAIYPPNVAHVETIRAAIDSARDEKRGIWSGTAFLCKPADHRSGRCR